ncbi:hypothetical protein ASE61_00685 [Bosea sp. Root670]|uniref:hypothetical protein n=1 Tax=Bosea sp. Root670 TaxID=1736583 RepID=UPI0007158E4D|nr:hypothetical protein [Bosea sp. Root670]KRE08167.1 hypothetical protein ASE61_00685 [Bosea sp. Root670]
MRHRTVTLSFGALRASERLSWLEEMDRENGASRDLLLITDLDSANLGRDSLWGLVDEVSPVLQPMGWLDGEPIYSKSLTLTERL